MRTWFSLLLTIALVTSCGLLPKFIPAGGNPINQPTDMPPTASTPPATATPGPTNTPPPKPAATLPSADEAIRLVKQKFPELQDIQKKPAGGIGASTDIVIQDRADGWNIIFWKGSGDCPSGCINNHYWYLAVDKSGTVVLAGEFVRDFDSAANAVKTSGAPMWGVPRQ
jgi:hypothetical protein